jgi:hypothetical protein
MSVALGWLAVLASFAGAPVPRVDGPSITYQIQVVELCGLGWREGTVDGLKPVASRGGVTVWTAPADFLKLLPEGTGKQVLMAPKLNALSQAAAHITTRRNHPFVTQVCWRGETAAPRQTTENVREGLAATVSGRAIDQGVLVQLVIENTEIRSVHTLNLPDPNRCFNIGAQFIPLEDFEPKNWNMTEMPNSAQAFCPASCQAAATDAATKQATWHASSKESCCADDEANATECHATRTDCSTAEKSKSSPTRSAQVQVPEIGRAEIAGEWLIPRDEVLLVGFGPHTVADEDGKAVVRERLAMITATEVAMPTVDLESSPLGLPRPLPKVARTPAAPFPSPSLPSRSLPQGVHADGTPAELPPLPDDEKNDSSPRESSEPRPSPQKHRVPSSPAPAARPPATEDTKATKATFTLPKGLFKQPSLPQLMLPNLQFMMPLKPFELKLPFNQKLELELIGRVVADPETATDGPSAE